MRRVFGGPGPAEVEALRGAGANQPRVLRRADELPRVDCLTECGGKRRRLVVATIREVGEVLIGEMSFVANRRVGEFTFDHWHESGLMM